MSSSSPSPNPQALFELMKRVNTAQKLWRRCDHSQCHARRACSGGPRGTCALTGGFTACSDRGRALIERHRDRQQWKARAAAGESPSEAEVALRLEMAKLERLADEAFEAD